MSSIDNKPVWPGWRTMEVLGKGAGGDAAHESAGAGAADASEKPESIEPERKSAKKKSLPLILGAITLLVVLAVALPGKKEKPAIDEPIEVSETTAPGSL